MSLFLGHEQYHPWSHEKVQDGYKKGGLLSPYNLFYKLTKEGFV